MSRIERTPGALRDLRAIVRLIAADNLSAALSWVDSIEERFRVLASQPSIGERFRSRRTGKLRRSSVGNYVIYYLPLPDGVQIRRVIHGARKEPF